MSSKPAMLVDASEARLRSSALMGERMKKLSTDQLPALIKALKDAGVDVKTP
jgi:hypothetical protein